MNHGALIEYNKYSLALAAACFGYALDKFVPMPTPIERYVVLFTLSVFFLCAVLGVIIFAAATAAQHPSRAKDVPKINRLIGPVGSVHTTLLIVGLLALGYLVQSRVLTPPEPPKSTACCQSPAPTK